PRGAEERTGHLPRPFEEAPGRFVGPRDLLALDVEHPADVAAALVVDEEPRRHALRHERRYHRAGRGADDVIGARGVEAGGLREREERADDPGAAENAAAT